MYKCKVSVFMTVLYTCSLTTVTGSQRHSLLVTGSELSSSSLPFPSASSLKGAAVGYTGDPGEVGCFSITGAELNAICFFLFKE